MDNSTIEELLSSHDIKATANRIVVLRALSEAKRTMSLSELESKIITIDKSGIFRALTLFRENHLVHVIEDGSDSVRYELCRSKHHEEHNDMHVHFFCERCHRTFCIEDTPTPIVSLPEGYQMWSVNYMAKGICPDCATTLT